MGKSIKFTQTIVVNLVIVGLEPYSHVFDRALNHLRIILENGSPYPIKQAVYHPMIPTNFHICRVQEF